MPLVLVENSGFHLSGQAKVERRCLAQSVDPRIVFGPVQWLMRCLCYEILGGDSIDD